MITSDQQDPIAKLAGRLSASAMGLRTRLRDRAIPRALRSEGRRLLVEVFRTCEEAPEKGKAGRRTWMASGREQLTAIDQLHAAIERALKPPPPFYSGDRLGVIRRMEPVRIRFAVGGRLGLAEDLERFDRLGRGLERRVRWLWGRLERAHPELFQFEEDTNQPKRMRDENELVWGRVHH